MAVNEIRADEWRAIKNNLKDRLDSIPFTATQRNDIDRRVEMLEDLFKAANK